MVHHTAFCVALSLPCIGFTLCSVHISRMWNEYIHSIHNKNNIVQLNELNELPDSTTVILVFDLVDTVLICSVLCTNWYNTSLDLHSDVLQEWPDNAMPIRIHWCGGSTIFHASHNPLIQYSEAYVLFDSVLNGPDTNTHLLECNTHVTLMLNSSASANK